MKFSLSTNSLKNTMIRFEKQNTIPLIDYLLPKNRTSYVHTNLASIIINSIKTHPKAYHYISLKNLNHDIVNISAILATAQCTNTSIVIHQETTESNLDINRVAMYLQRSFPDTRIYTTHVIQSSDSIIQMLEDVVLRQNKANINLVCDRFFSESNTAYTKTNESYLAAAKTLLRGNSNIIFSNKYADLFQNIHIPLSNKVINCLPHSLSRQSLLPNTTFEAIQYLPTIIQPNNPHTNGFTRWRKSPESHMYI
jgi:hypothetical protein